MDDTTKTRRPPMPPHFSVISPEEHRALSAKGGRRAAESRAERKKLREELEALLSSGDVQERLCTALISEAIEGKSKAFAFSVLRDTLGEKMPSKLDLTAVGADLAGFKERHIEEIRRLCRDEMKREEPLYGSLARDLLGYEETRELMSEVINDECD